MPDPDSVYYVAVSPVCGGWVMVSLMKPNDTPERKSDTLREAAKAAKQGYDIKTMTREEWQKSPMCECPYKKGKKDHQPQGQPVNKQLSLMGAER